MCEVYMLPITCMYIIISEHVYTCLINMFTIKVYKLLLLHKNIYVYCMYCIYYIYCMYMSKCVWKTN